ncbi:hypothetical protein [Kitasatospora sp. NPDC004531]
MRPIAVRVVAVAVLTAASACAAGQPNPKPDAAGPAAAATSAVASAAPDGLFTAVPLPLDAYRPTDDQSAALTAAFNVLDHACMQAKGFDYPPAPYLRPQPRPATPVNFMRYGEDTEPAAALGDSDYRYYWTGRRGGPDPAVSMTAAEHAAQTDPSGGCARQAADRLSADGGDYLNPASTVGDLDQQSFVDSMEDARVKAVFAAWSACMRGRGFTADAPMGRQVNPFGWPHEQRLADVGCKRQVDLVRIWSDVEAELQRKLIADHAQALDTERQRREATVRNAAAVLTANSR